MGLRCGDGVIGEAFAVGGIAVRYKNTSNERRKMGRTVTKAVPPIKCLGYPVRAEPLRRI